MWLICACVLLGLLVKTAVCTLPPVPVRGLAPQRRQLISFLSGGLAGTISSSLTIPLEVVKTQLQSSRNKQATAVDVARKILREQGPMGFFRGLKPLLFGIVPTRAVYFWAYSCTKTRLAQTPLRNSPIAHVLSAFSAGIISNTITNPIWMVRTRFQVTPSSVSYADTCRQIWRDEGLGGFFKGLGASYAGCCEGAIQWLVYEKLKSRIDKRDTHGLPRRLSASRLFWSAAASKFCAIVLTYPHEVVRTRMRELVMQPQFSAGQLMVPKYTGFVQSLRCIAKEEGVRGLYAGLGMHLLRSVPNAAVMFVSYELLSHYLERASAPPSPNT